MLEGHFLVDTVEFPTRFPLCDIERKDHASIFIRDYQLHFFLTRLAFIELSTKLSGERGKVESVS